LKKEARLIVHFIKKNVKADAIKKYRLFMLLKNYYVHEIKVSYYIKVGKSTTSLANQVLYTVKQNARNNFYSKSGNFDEDVCLPL